MNQPLTILATFMATFIFTANVLWIADWIAAIIGIGAVILVYAMWPPRPEEEAL